MPLIERRWTGVQIVCKLGQTLILGQVATHFQIDIKMVVHDSQGRERVDVLSGYHFLKCVRVKEDMLVLQQNVPVVVRLCH